jgi:hypothetical protein
MTTATCVERMMEDTVAMDIAHADIASGGLVMAQATLGTADQSSNIAPEGKCRPECVKLTMNIAPVVDITTQPPVRARPPT